MNLLDKKIKIMKDKNNVNNKFIIRTLIVLALPTKSKNYQCYLYNFLYYDESKNNT